MMNKKTRQFIEMSLKTLTAILVFVLVISAFYVPAQAAPSQVPTGQRLRTLAGSFLIGYASRNDFWNMSDSAIYQETARTEFNFMTPENAMKWDATEPSQNNFTFSQADQHVAFAQTNNMVIHGHTLVWHSQLPQWVSNGNWTSSTLTSAMYNHIDTVMNHWDNGEIAVWDVVNEAFEDNGTRRASVFQNVIGNSYIELAFQRARAADPQTVLLYNDYNIETINSKSNAVYAMASDFVNRGVPIDGIGFQMHLTNGGMNYQSFTDNMARFAALGLDIYITEMDVRYPTPVSQTDMNNQAAIYTNVISRCLAQPACKALQVWGIPDKYSWVPDVFPGQGAPLIFDDNYNAKPSYYALQTALGGTGNPTNTPTGPTATRTNTPIGPTATRTNTPVGPTNTPTTGGALKVQLMAGGTDNNQQASFRYRIQNTGSTAQSNISVRVYFTLDGSQAASSYVFEKYYDQSGVATVSGPTQVSGSSYYFTVNYGTTSLAAGSAWEFHTAMHLNNWGSNFSSSNDWWRSTGTLPASYTDWSNLPAYVSGSLVWGSQPDGTPPTNTPIGPTATRTNTPVGPTATRTNTPIVPTATRTNTPVVPTATRTSTLIPNTPTFTPIVVTNTPTTGTTTLKIQYRAADTNAGDNQVKPHFNIVNGGASSVPLSELKIRYWFTREGTASQNFWCDWAATPGSCTNVTGTFVQTAGAIFYLEVGFTSAAGSITAGGQSGEIQTRFAKADWSNYIETDDYSFDPTKTSFADWTRVTLYRNGVLVWGIEP